MSVNQIIMYILSFGAALGGVDLILGNRFGFGEKFESGFRMMGSVALSMAGIICLAPVLSRVLGTVVSPVCEILRLDPGVFGSILAIDMGGCQLSVDLAKDPDFGLFSGVILASIFGCTVVFSIPVGLGFLREEDRPFFTKGILIGLATLPVSIIAAALMLQLPLGYILWNCLPVLLISLFLGIGVLRRPESMMRGFLTFANGIRVVGILGLTFGAVTSLSGIPLVKDLLPLEDAMATVSSICIAMLGSLPMAELIQRLMKVPFERISRKTGLDSSTATGLLLGLVTATPALAMIPQMNRRGQVVASAFLVSGVCTFGAHFAVADTLYPHTVPALLAAKLLGGLIAGLIAMFAVRNSE